MTVTLDKFGRVLIPKPLRDQLGLQPGAELSLDVHEGGDGAPSLEVRVVPHKEGGLTQVDGVLVHDGLATAATDTSRILRDIYDSRARRHAGLDPDAW